MPNSTLIRLQDYIQGDLDVNVCVASAGCQEQDITLQRLSLHQDIASTFKLNAVKTIQADLSREPLFKCYEPGFRPDEHELCYVPVDTLPELVADTIRSVRNLEHAEMFTESDEIIDRLKFYSVIVGEGDNAAVFFRTFSPKNELSKSKWYALTFWDGAYNMVEDKIFLFDNSYDCYYYDGLLYIKSISKFHTIFRYFEGLKANAESIADSIGQRIPIYNFDDFKSACTGQLQMMAKLSAIARKPYITTVTMDNIKRTVQEFDLEVQFRDDNGTEKLVFEASPQRRWTILKLLDDDYLGSVMTNLKYEVNSKSSIR